MAMIAVDGIAQITMTEHPKRLSPEQRTRFFRAYWYQRAMCGVHAELAAARASAQALDALGDDETEVLGERMWLRERGAVR